MSIHEFWARRLSEHLDGDLSPEGAEALDAHLATCEPCRALARDLGEVRRRAQAMGGLAPPRDLWAGIEARLPPASTGLAASNVLDLTPHLGAHDSWATAESSATPHRGRLGGALAAAAALALLMGAGVGGWTLRSHLIPPAESTLEAGPDASSLLPRFTGVGDGTLASEVLAREVAQLERLLMGDPSGLDANTVRVLRKNLVVIQTAIAESRAALVLDPDNSYVRRHLEGTVERQRAFLRQAAALLAAADD